MLQVVERVSMTIDALQELAHYLAGIPGRRSLLLRAGIYDNLSNLAGTLEIPLSAVHTMQAANH